jgi:hypothetical protein
MCTSAPNDGGEQGTLHRVPAIDVAFAASRPAPRKGAGISTNLKRSARSRCWFGAIALGLLAGIVLGVIVPWTAVSSAGVPGDDPRYGRATVAEGEADARASERSTTMKPRRWPRCPECGVIDAVRPIAESVRALDRADAVERARTRALRAVADDAIGAHDDVADSYEVTVRFLDGSTTTFDTAAPRRWPVGGRVSVIAGRETTAP